MHPIGLYFLTDGGIDHCRGEVRSIGTNRAYNRHPLPVSIVKRLLISTLLVESLIEDSFSLSNDPNHESLLVHIVGVLREDVKFRDFLS